MHELINHNQKGKQKLEGKFCNFIVNRDQINKETRVVVQII